MVRDGRTFGFTVQVPPEQYPVLQAFPQVPQLAGSVFVSLQADPQYVFPTGQLHAPRMHVSFWPVHA